jgi:hypothetical protein
MKAIIILLIAGLTVACTPEPKYEIVLTNTSDRAVKDAGVVIPRAALEELPEVTEGLIPVLTGADGTNIPLQADDLDGDGSWDELFIVTDLEGGEKMSAALAFRSPDNLPELKVRTNLRFARKDKDYLETTTGVREQHAVNTETQKVWQMEGMAWENDKVGFRNYFDRRNGMDIFGKVTTEMVLDGVGYKDAPSYHDYDPGWGADVLKVGNSLGAGSIAFLHDGALFRVGDNGNGTCTVLTEGPLRSMFRFGFEGWQMGNESLDVVHDIAISAGKYYYESEVEFSGTDAAVQLVSGIVNMLSDELHEVETGVAVKAFYTHDYQSDDGTRLGMGLMVKEEDFAGISEAPESGEGIVDSYCLHMKVAAGKPVKFRFYTVWERENEQWETAAGFEKLLREEAEQMAAPVSWSLVKK